VKEQHTLVRGVDAVEGTARYEMEKVADESVSRRNVVDDAVHDLLELQAKFCPLGRNGHGSVSRQHNGAMGITHGCAIA
jgi:hypothetical protein